MQASELEQHSKEVEDILGCTQGNCTVHGVVPLFVVVVVAGVVTEPTTTPVIEGT